MSDDDHAGDEEEHEESDPAEAVAKGAETAEKLAEMASEIGSGDSRGAVEAGLGAVGEGAESVAAALGADEGDARTVAEAVGTAAEVAKSVIEAVGHLTGEEHGEGGRAGRSQHQRHERSAHPALGRQSEHGEAVGFVPSQREVRYHLEVDGFEADFAARHVELHEALSELYTCIVDAPCRAHPEVSELLGKDAHLQIERGEELRSIHGIVRHATVQESQTGTNVRLHIVPAMWLLDQSFRSRVWTDKTIPEVVEEVYAERLGARGRAISTVLTGTYPRHELLVQYQESDLAFVRRRLEQEGIFTYFRHDGDHEELVLVDSNDGLPLATEREAGQIPWAIEAGASPTGEDISQARHVAELGATDVVVRAYNWTAPAVAAEGTATDRGEQDPSLEVYDHTDAVELHEYDAGQRRYGANDASVQARIRAELLDLRRNHWELASTVVGARPGHVLELVGCPDGELDGRYLIVGVDARGQATEGESGGYSNRMRVIPVDLPYRPARRTPVPVVHGPETAIVAGPDGEEIHTDEHGRVQVKFHWDREHALNEPSLASCWLRVMHSWAGPGFGTTFIPRIGMEVVVSFLGGNPDRPIVVGCVYHGTNASPVVTPDDKTQSAIRTKSSPNSEGFNELRFEDKAGSEFIYTHAQKDYNEVVEHCHSTHVKVDQSNTVDHDQTETIGNDQTLLVKGFREKTVENSETTEVQADRTETVFGREAVNIKAQRRHHMEDDDITVVDKHRTTQVGKKYTITSTEQYKVVQNSINELYMDDCLVGLTIGRIRLESGEGVKWTAEPGGVLTTKTSDKWQLESESAMTVEVGGKAAQLEMKKGGQITLEAQTQITLSVGKSSFIKLTASGIEIEGPAIKINAASGVTEIDAASQVKIKC